MKQESSQETFRIIREMEIMQKRYPLLVDYLSLSVSRGAWAESVLQYAQAYVASLMGISSLPSLGELQARYAAQQIPTGGMPRAIQAFQHSDRAQLQSGPQSGLTSYNGEPPVPSSVIPDDAFTKTDGAAIGLTKSDRLGRGEGPARPAETGLKGAVSGGINEQEKSEVSGGRKRKSIGHLID